MKYYTKKQIFYVNSTRRINGTNSSFSHFLNIDPNEDYDRVAVLAASIPKSYYLIDSNHNTFTLKEGTDEVPIIFPPGNYTRNSIVNKSQTLLNQASPNNFTYSVSFQNINNDVDDGKLTFTVSGNGAVQPEFIFSTQMYEQLGFNRSSNNVFVDNSLISTNVINLVKETTVFIHSDICQNSEGDNVLQEIYTVGDSSFTMVNYENKNPMEYSKKLVPGKSNVYHFWLTNENGEVLDTNGVNINLTIMIYQSNDIDHLIKGAIKYFTMKE